MYRGPLTEPGNRMRTNRRDVTIAALVLLTALASGIAVAIVASVPKPARPRITRAAFLTRRHFATQVLAEAPIPVGSYALSSAPRLLNAPAESPDIPGLVDLHRIYATPESPDAIRNDVLGRIPKGADETGKGSSGGPGGSTSDFEISIPTYGANEYFAQLVYTIATSAIGSRVRIDAQSVWEPDRRASERVPAVAIAELTGYSTVSAEAGGEGAHSITLDPSESTRLAEALNSLPVGPKPTCLEGWVVYRIVFRTLSNGTYTVDGNLCGFLMGLQENGRTLSELHDARCSFSRLIAKFLPNGAIGTRQLVARCLPANSFSGFQLPKVLSAAVRSRLTRIAEALSAMNCEPSPRAVFAVATTRGAALTVATPGDLLGSGNGDPVYLLTMEGNFTDIGASRPPGAAAPKGHFLGLVIDRATYQVLDYGISEKLPRVLPASLGATTPLTIRLSKIASGC